MKYKVSLKTREVSFAVPKSASSLELLQGAAYVLTDRCTAYVEPQGKAHVVTLKAAATATKEDLAALADLFNNELLNQALRQRLLSRNRVIMEHVITRAMVSARADEAAGAPAAEKPLSEDQQKEIDRLIAEAEAEVAALVKNRKGADPLGITKTWEERHGKPRT
jgi:His-Xaa-Ser system protein HxsD